VSLFDGSTLKIVQAGHPVLRQPSRPLTHEEITSPEARQLVDFMRDTMRDAPGVGLAAPQVGLPLQIAVLEDRSEYHKAATAEQLAERQRLPVPLIVLFNPKIVKASDETAEFFEGCLSVAGFSALVKRATSITVEYVDPNAQPQQIEASGWFARILQHEIDHLNGTLYVDRMESRSFATIENITRYWRDVPIAKVREALQIKK
jgi:peptide deformylase